MPLQRNNQIQTIVALLALWCTAAAANAPTSLTGYDWGLRSLYPRQSFKSFDLEPPLVNFLQWSEACNHGHTLLTPRGTLVWQPAPLIVDGRGELVWMDDRFGEVMNLDVQEYKGEQYLTFWTGQFDEGCGRGHYYMLDSSYQVFRQFSPAGSIRGDFHEIKITKKNTVLITMYDVSPADLSKFGVWGQGWISDSIFQEIDIETGELLFEWRASEHYDITDTYEAIGSKGGSPEKAWDFFHINSIDKDDEGNYYVSSRFMHSITCISPTGETRWVLGGERNDFTDMSDGKAISSKWQHDMTLHDNMTISLFDNAEHDKFVHDGTVGRGMVISLNIEKMTAEILQTFDNPDGRAPPSQGSMQYDSATSAAFVGWGFHGGYTDFDSEGNVLCHAHITPSLTFDLGWVHSYRTMRTDSWVGKPAAPPSLYMTRKAAGVFVSWNGATEVKRWRLEMANVPDAPMDDLEFVEIAHVAKRGFETYIDLPARYTHAYLRVAAVNAEDRTLGHTAIVDTDKGSAPKVLSPRLRLQKLVSDIPKYLLALLIVGIVMWSVRKRLTWILRLCAKAPGMKQLARRRGGKQYEMEPLYRD